MLRGLWIALREAIFWAVVAFVLDQILRYAEKKGWWQ